MSELALVSLGAHLAWSAIAVIGTVVWFKLSPWWRARQRERRNSVIEMQMLGMRRVRLKSDDGIHWYKELDWPHGGTQ